MSYLSMVAQQKVSWFFVICPLRRFISPPVPQVANIIRRDDLDIVRPEWIFDSIKANDLVLLKKKWVISRCQSFS